MGRLITFLRRNTGSLGVALLLNTTLSVMLPAGIGGSAPAAAADMPVKVPTAPGAYKPMSLGGWMFSPSLFVGAVYNSNVNQTEAKVASWGERVVPAFVASMDNGIHHTSIYGLADIHNFTNASVADRTTVDAKIGVTQTYLAQRDLTFRFNADFTRQADVFGGVAFAQPSTPLGVTSGAPVAPPTVAPQISPVRFNQYSGSIAGEKRVNRTFFALGFTAVGTQFENEPAGTSSRDGAVYTVNGRAGFDLTPRIYAFVDPAVNWQRYSDTARNADGYRITAGLGTAAPGIWQGEVFGGYQAEDNDIVGTYDSGVLGIRLGYSPTRFWDLRATVDETLGASTIAVGGLSGVATRVTTALLNVGYNGMPKGWKSGARFGFVRTDFVNSTRDDDAWLAGVNLGYEIWRNFGVTFDYQYKTVDSNVAGQSFNQHAVSIGATYTY